MSEKVEFTQSQKMILSLIGRGKENARTVAYISKLVGLPSVAVREIVSELVTKYGIGIGTSNDRRTSGYYYIANDEEKEETLRNLKSRAHKILQRAKAIEKMADPEQMKINF